MQLKDKINNICFQDTYTHLSFSLSDLASKFKIQGLKKGDFPHEINVDNYMSPTMGIQKRPSVEVFNFESMKCNKASDRNEYLKKKEDYQKLLELSPEYDPWKEFVEYCEQDVDVITYCFLKYRQAIMKSTSMNLNILGIVDEKKNEIS